MSVSAQDAGRHRDDRPVHAERPSEPDHRRHRTTCHTRDDPVQDERSPSGQGTRDPEGHPDEGCVAERAQLVT